MALGGRIRFRRKLSPRRIIAKVVGLVIILWVGDEILTTIRDTVMDVNADYNTSLGCEATNLSAAQRLTWHCVENTRWYTTGYFQSAFSFIGLNSTSYTGIIAVIGIMAVATLALEFIEVNI